MTSPVGQSVLHAIQTQQRCAGVSVTYTPKATGTESDPLTAVPTKSEFEALGAAGIVVDTMETKDFLFIASELPSTPARGDRVNWGTKVYELMPTGDGRWFSEMDGEGIGYRLHTKRIN